MKVCRACLQVAEQEQVPDVRQHSRNATESERMKKEQKAARRAHREAKVAKSARKAAKKAAKAQEEIRIEPDTQDTHVATAAKASQVILFFSQVVKT